MKRTLRILLLVLALSICTLPSCAKQPNIYFNHVNEVMYPYIDEVKSYLEAGLEKLPREFVNENVTDNCKDNTVSWSFDGDGLKNFIFEISTNKDFSNTEKKTILPAQSEYTLSNLLRSQKYYIRITAVCENGTVSDTASFETTPLGPRVLNFGGDFRGNFRDMGGYTTLDGNKIPQNLIIRGAALDDGSKTGGIAIGQKGMDFLNRLGIKLEIDLRNRTEQNGRTVSEITGARYVNYPIVQYSGAFDKNQAWLYSSIFREFADRNNYPVFFHCAAGADRTGTVGAILESLLNFDEKDIIMDYELSSFYQVGLRERFDIERIYGELEEWPDNDKGSRQEGAEAYLLSIGVTDREIKQIKSILYGWNEDEFPFRDVTENDYFFNPVFTAREKNVTAGIGDGCFGPDNFSTRSQTVMFLWKAAGCPKSEVNLTFTDVPQNAYYSDALSWAYENGIVYGTNENTFSPDSSCTRAQAIMLLWKYCSCPANTGTITDYFTDATNNEWYANAVAWAYENSVTSGTSSGKFSAEQPCTRAQMVTFVFNALWK